MFDNPVAILTLFTVMLRKVLVFAIVGFVLIDIVSAQSITLDTLPKNQKNIISSKTILEAVNLHCRIINHSQWNSFGWEGQLNPKVYSRVYLYPQLTIGLLPFTGKFNLSTEPFSSYNPGYNRFSLRFDTKRFNTLIEEEIRKKTREKIISPLKIDPIIAQAQDSINRYTNLTKELTDAKYLKKIEQQKQLLMDTLQMDSFSKMQNKYQILEAKSLLDKHAEKLKYAEKLTDWKQKLSVLDSMAIERPELIDRDSLIKVGRNSLPCLYKIMSNVQELNLGVSYPIISPYTMMGTALNGGYTKIKTGNLITAIGFGTTLPTRYSSYFFSRPDTGRNNLLISTVGYQKKTGLQLLLHVLRSHEGQYKYKSFEKEDVRNIVVSLEGKQEIKSGSIEVEAARSASASYYENKSTTAIYHLLTQNNSIKNHAFRIKGNYNVKATSSILQLQGKYVGGQFKSRGTPYLRSDVAGMNANLKQFFWRKKLFVQADLGKELMQVSHYKDSKNGWNTFTFQGGISIPGYPNIVAGYVPTRQYFEYIESDSSVYSTMDMKFIQASHVLQITDIPVSLTAYYSDSKASTVNYEFLNRNIMCAVSVPLGNRYIIHSDFMQSTITLIDKPVNYKNFTLDFTRNFKKGALTTGGQYRESEQFRVSSLFAAFSAPAFLRYFATSFRFELMDVTRMGNSNETIYNQTQKSTIEAGASAIIAYSF